MNGKTAALRLLAATALALTMTGCASVKLSMSDGAGGGTSAHTAERAQLSAALTNLEQQPWVDASAEKNDGLMTMIFAVGGPSPKALANTYLEAIESTPEQTVLTVRRDMETTLSEAWAIAQLGRDAARGSQPVKSDLRTIEAAIVETRESRLVYAETMSMLAKRDGTVDRAEIRRMKAGYNQAILELGRTADALSARLKEGRKTNVASGASGSISSN
ncbi:MAG: hypothetical protein AAF830_00295 [Pseudomonadota bacterium]